MSWMYGCFCSLWTKCPVETEGQGACKPGHLCLSAICRSKVQELERGTCPNALVTCILPGALDIWVLF